MAEREYTAEDFRRFRTWLESDPTIATYMVPYLAIAALRIAERVMTPGLLDGLIADNCDKLANKAADTIRAALTKGGASD